MPEDDETPPPTEGEPEKTAKARKHQEAVKHFQNLQSRGLSLPKQPKKEDRSHG